MFKRVREAVIEPVWLSICTLLVVSGCSATEFPKVSQQQELAELTFERDRARDSLEEFLRRIEKKEAELASLTLANVKSQAEVDKERAEIEGLRHQIQLGLEEKRKLLNISLRSVCSPSPIAGRSPEALYTFLGDVFSSAW